MSSHRWRDKAGARHGVAWLLALAALVAALSGCPSPVVSVLDDLVLDITAATRDQPGYSYVLDLVTSEDGYTRVGESSTRLVPIQNAGDVDLVLTDATVYRHLTTTGSSGEAEISGTESMQTIFMFTGGREPDWPITVAPGELFEGLYLTFTPRTSGLETGVLVVRTEVGTRSVFLSGIGAFRLRLSVNTGQEGEIVRPVAVGSGETVDYWTTTTEVTLEATGNDPVGLSRLDGWTLVSPAETAEIADPAALITEVSIYDHAEIQAVFDTPYLFVNASVVGGLGDGSSRADAFADFVAAVSALDPATDDGIVVAAGTYTVSANLTLKKGQILGGYNADFTARSYQTEADRIDAAYQTIIALQNAELRDDADMDESTIFEGFTITGGANTTSGAASLRLSNGSSPAIRYNTISGPAQGYAIYLSGSTATVENNVLSVGSQTNDAVVVGIEGCAPAVRSNTITAGAGGTRSIGVFLYGFAEPTISANTINAGDPTGSGSESVGIYIDANYTDQPAATITGNTILPGASADTSDGKSFGIFAMNEAWTVIEDNTISGGSGSASAYALCLGYGTQPQVRRNSIFTVAGSTRRGILIKANGRIRVLETNNFTECPDGFVSMYDHGEYELLSTIDEVNEEFLDSTDRADETKLNTNEAL